MTDDEDRFPPSRHHFKKEEPEPEPESITPAIHHVIQPMPTTLLREDTFGLIKKAPRVINVPGPANARLETPLSSGFKDVDITASDTVPYTMKFISLNNGRTWYEVYKTSVEVREFNYGSQHFYLPILHCADQHTVYGRLHDTSDGAIRSILYKKVDAKELLPDGTE